MLPLLFLLTACSPEPGLDSGPAPDDTALEPGGDLDGDGIDNGTELQEGTDPRDPSSASAWHPEWTQRPRLLTDPAGMASLSELAAREEEPWSTLRARISARCASTPMDEDPDLTCATVNGNIALACAVEYLLGEAEAGARAASILEGLPVAAEIDVDTLMVTDLHASQGLLQGARAYDLLLATGYPEGHDPDQAQARLHELGAFLWDYYVERYPQWMEYAQNNHSTKLAAAFGVLGMAAWDDPRSARYVNYAVAELHRLRAVLYSAEGGYAEGPGYLVYAMESELPFMLAYDRWAGEEGRPVMGICDHDPDPDCEPSLQLLGSPLRDPRVCSAFERFVEQLMPGGYGPNTDDSNLASAQLGLVAGLCGSASAAWGWSFQASDWASAGSVDLSADTLLAWQAAPLPLEPQLGPYAWFDGGWAVVRSGWQRDSAYALLLAEHGAVLEAGGGHEHPDNLSYLWAAAEHYLLIDAGYGNWNEHQEVNDPEAHNLFLVDGEGPGAAEAFLDGAWVEGELRGVGGHTSYRGLDWTRRVTLAGEDVLVVWDQVAPSQDGALELALLTQGPSTGMVLDGGLASWQLDGLELQLRVVADVELGYAERIEEHAFGYSDYRQHSVLEASASIDAPTRWLTVARIGEAGADAGLEIVEDGVVWPGGSVTHDGCVTVGETSVELSSR